MNDRTKITNPHDFPPIGLLVGVGVLGIFSAIALLPVRGCACGPNSEAKQYIGTMNRAQQVYLLDSKDGDETGEFANEIDKLGLGIARETKNYKYLLRATDTATFHYAIPKNEKLKAYVGSVFVVQTAESGTLAILCEADSPGKVLLAEPKLSNAVPTCATGTEPL